MAQLSRLEASSLQQPAFMHEKVLLTPDGDGWIVEKGHVRVALLMVLAAQEDRTVETMFQQAIAESLAADDSARDWRRRWQANLAENPRIQYALEVSPDELYRAAGLSIAEQIAMHAWSQLNDDGEPRSTREIARDLKEPESTVRTRLERGVTKLRGLRHVVAAAPAEDQIEMRPFSDQH